MPNPRRTVDGCIQTQRLTAYKDNSSLYVTIKKYQNTPQTSSKNTSKHKKNTPLTAACAFQPPKHTKRPEFGLFRNTLYTILQLSKLPPAPPPQKNGAAAIKNGTLHSALGIHAGWGTPQVSSLGAWGHSPGKQPGGLGVLPSQATWGSGGTPQVAACGSLGSCAGLLLTPRSRPTAAPRSAAKGHSPTAPHDEAPLS